MTPEGLPNARNGQQMSYFHFLCVFLSTSYTQLIYQYTEGVDTVSMSDFDNDGLATEGGFKRKYEVLLKEHMELKEQEKKKVKILESLENKLEERVRCPVCLEVPTSCPMYSCANGNLLPGLQLQLLFVQNQDGQDRLPPGQNPSSRTLATAASSRLRVAR